MTGISTAIRHIEASIRRLRRRHRTALVRQASYGDYKKALEQYGYTDDDQDTIGDVLADMAEKAARDAAESGDWDVDGVEGKQFLEGEQEVEYHRPGTRDPADLIEDTVWFEVEGPDTVIVGTFITFDYDDMASEIAKKLGRDRREVLNFLKDRRVQAELLEDVKTYLDEDDVTVDLRGNDRVIDEVRDSVEISGEEHLDTYEVGYRVALGTAEFEVDTAEVTSTGFEYWVLCMIGVTLTLD